MESPYRPPRAELGAPQPQLLRPLWKAVGAGFVASVASLAAIVTAVDFLPILTPPSRATVCGCFGMAGLIGGWVAAWVHRGRGEVPAFVLAALLVALVSSTLTPITWVTVGALGAYAGAALVGGFIGRDG